MMKKDINLAVLTAKNNMVHGLGLQCAGCTEDIGSQATVGDLSGGGLVCTFVEYYIF